VKAPSRLSSHRRRILLAGGSGGRKGTDSCPPPSPCQLMQKVSTNEEEKIERRMRQMDAQVQQQLHYASLTITSIGL